MWSKIAFSVCGLILILCAARLNPAAGVSGQHVLVKVVNKEEGIETHRISRVTTVNWKDKEGKERWLQFVSLQGFHKR